MSKLTTYQRHKKAGQPHTRLSLETRYEEVETEVDGKTVKGLKPMTDWAIYGYTLELKLKPNSDEEDPEWEDVWEEHDLGHESDLGEAYTVSQNWRDSLVGVYPIG